MATATLIRTAEPEGREAEHDIRVQTPAGPALLRVRGRNRKFSVVSFEVTDRPELCLAFSPTGSGVENLDDQSDIAQCFNLSSEIRYNGMRMSASQMSAYSIEDLVSALGALKLRVFDPEEI
jgi:hypothetical protein